MLSIVELVILGGLCYGCLAFLILTLSARDRDIGFGGILLCIVGFIAAFTLAGSGLDGIEFRHTTGATTINGTITMSSSMEHVTIMAPTVWVYLHVTLGITYGLMVIYGVFQYLGRATE